jgi:hypothetical protein
VSSKSVKLCFVLARNFDDAKADNIMVLVLLRQFYVFVALAREISSSKVDVGLAVKKLILLQDWRCFQIYLLDVELSIL